MHAQCAALEVGDIAIVGLVVIAIKIGKTFVGCAQCFHVFVLLEFYWATGLTVR
jgi:hypothetical protein